MRGISQTKLKTQKHNLCSRFLHASTYILKFRAAGLRVEASLGKILTPNCSWYWSAPCMASHRRQCMNVCMNYYKSFWTRAICKWSTWITTRRFFCPFLLRFLEPNRDNQDKQRKDIMIHGSFIQFPLFKDCQSLNILFIFLQAKQFIVILTLVSYCSVWCCDVWC